jgi:hypothetical protein
MKRATSSYEPFAASSAARRRIARRFPATGKTTRTSVRRVQAEERLLRGAAPEALIAGANGDGTRHVTPGSFISNVHFGRRASRATATVNSQHLPPRAPTAVQRTLDRASTCRGRWVMGRISARQCLSSLSRWPRWPWPTRHRSSSPQRLARWCARWFRQRQDKSPCTAGTP